MADKSMLYSKDKGADFFVRYKNKAFTMEDENGRKFNMFDKVKCLKIGEILEFKANIFPFGSQKLSVRFCILKKSSIEGD